MSRFFIKRPVFAIVIALIMVILGGIAAIQLPVAQYPEISPPTVTVSTNYTGADASVVNETVAQTIESEINGVQGMDYMSSNSDASGAYSLEVVFKLGTDGDMDAVKTQNNVAAADASLPGDVQSVGVTTRKSSSDMALMISLYSPKGTYDSVFLKNYADLYLLDKIKRVTGVGNVASYGADYAMRVWLNPDKLAMYGLTVADVTSAIKEQNIQAPAGAIGQMPASRHQEKQYIGKIKGRLKTIKDFENVVVEAQGDGSFVRLKDVARIVTGAKENTFSAYQNGKEAFSFGVSLTNDANAMQTVKAVQDIMTEGKKHFPPGMEYKEVVDSTRYIHASIEEVLHTFAEALVLVIIIVYLFLQSWRATLIPVLAIPVSLIATLAAFVILDFSINTLTLFAMVLAIGLVVDDAIVVIENVEHHMQEDRIGVREATERAMDEVQGPVVAIAFVLAAVFIPAAFLGGMMGVLYKQFALTIAISMALSAFVALTLTPSLCVLLLKTRIQAGQTNRLARFFAKFNNGFDALKHSYLKQVIWMISKTKYCILFLILLIIGIGALYKIVPSTFVPDEDQGYFMTAVNLPEGTSMNLTSETMHKLADEIMDSSGVTDVMEIIGFDALSNGQKANAGTMFISLAPWADRKDVKLKVDAQVAKVNEEGAENIPEAMVVAMNPPSLPGLGMISGFSLQLQDMSGHTDKELDSITKQIIKTANQRPELREVSTTFSINSPNAEFVIDRDKVKDLGINLADVFTAVQANFGGVQINDFNQFGHTYKVVLQADKNYRSELEAAKFIFVKNAEGTMVPLDTLLETKINTGASIISRFNGARSINIQGYPNDGYSSGQALKAMEDVVQQIAPVGFNIEWSGQSRQEKASGDAAFKILALAFVFVFLCLAALYESWSIPYAVLLTVPTGIFGALFSELVMAQPNSIYMQIGVIMIIGLAAKNAILIVEFAKVRVDKGIDPVRAAVTAAGLRLRPILMTSFAFIFGCMPLALAEGAGAGARNGMGIAVVGGMIFATAIGIFLIPVLFITVETIVAKWNVFRRNIS
ncbi:efflux RND transporter permease subunit [Pectinatus haikarae]|uniref:HAE1 family hydrophobic/amphiphilic exporter-1 n=1 Tax=Pectinatus haikarae TaxID=349096 RepID=A0ABT9Y3D8_9FIRM|nr:multidrug efflux RND transporter permease subunit [Pectinatus haikarae]MDQ0202339.1 HAE1 family hydrophobic/amphiphilic exporter-1 [Pectinatus haikarae]